MSSLIKNIIRFSLFILIQVYVLNQVPPLHHLVTPYIYFLFILWLPFKIGRRTLMLLAFATGFCLDCFMKTYRLHTAPCVLIAYLRPFLINLLISQEGAESNYNEPSIKCMCFTPQFTYVAILSLLHHSLLFFLHVIKFIIKTINPMLIIIFEFLLMKDNSFLYPSVIVML